jgi:hypothetical protein
MAVKMPYKEYLNLKKHLSKKQPILAKFILFLIFTFCPNPLLIFTPLFPLIL